MHNEATPLLGGLAIYIAMAVALIVFSPPQHVREFAALLSGAALLAFVGALDDKYNLSVRIRLVAMTIASLVVIAAGIHVQLFGTLWLDVPITVIWILAVTNAVNFNDNMDGLAAGLTGIAAGFFMAIAITQELSLVSALAAALLGSAVGFLIYNFNPARMFMGDMGSLVLGFTLAALGIKLEFGAQPLGVTWMVPLLVLALPLSDIVLVIATRFFEGRPLTQGGKDHMSHRIMSLGLSQRKTIFVLYAFCFIFGLLAVVVSLADAPVAWAVGVLSLVAIAIWMGFMVLIWQRARQSR
ncbi:MAG: undecaprenyl/decaprenyl-phosphate alpha-N-acetylglucosaminyl 1-phosphate transferase [Anaerolineae bacterium]|nr:undecaprenyl/decaprenyl-phosphate alpha-N-acetylglucosaminyl 1-phosphate transferase [Anaerolineae bacterium]